MTELIPMNQTETSQEEDGNQNGTENREENLDKEDEINNINEDILNKDASDEVVEEKEKGRKEKKSKRGNEKFHLLSIKIKIFNYNLNCSALPLLSFNAELCLECR